MYVLWFLAFLSLFPSCRKMQQSLDIDARSTANSHLILIRMVISGTVTQKCSAGFIIIE